MSRTISSPSLMHVELHGHRLFRRSKMPGVCDCAGRGMACDDSEEGIGPCGPRCIGVQSRVAKAGAKLSRPAGVQANCSDGAVRCDRRVKRLGHLPTRRVKKLKLRKGGSFPTFLVLDGCCTTSLPWTLEKDLACVRWIISRCHRRRVAGPSGEPTFSMLPLPRAIRSSTLERNTLRSEDVFALLWPITRSIVGASPCNGRL